MSLTITTDVFCDAPDCLAWIGGTTGARTDAPGARRAAKMHGWARRNRKDLCPEHSGLSLSADEQRVRIVLGGDAADNG